MIRRLAAPLALLTLVLVAYGVTAQDDPADTPPATVMTASQRAQVEMQLRLEQRLLVLDLAGYDEARTRERQRQERVTEVASRVDETLGGDSLSLGTLETLRDELDGAALRARLAGFAPWRYVALPASGETWCGILVPSHDRVGRAFPLTLAERCGAPAAPASPAECAARLARLQAAAAQGPEALESAIAALPAPHEQDGPHAQAWPAPPASLWGPLAAGDEAMPLRAAWPPQPALLLHLLGVQPAAHQIASAE